MSLRYASPSGDLGSSDLVIAALAEQLQGCLLKTSTSFFSATGHPPIIALLTVTATTRNVSY